MNFITVHILHALPLHNLNRDQNGLPKSQLDGGIQRARLSAQSIKRAARTSYRGQITGVSMRTRDAISEVLKRSAAYAAAESLAFDDKAGRRSVAAVVKSLTAEGQPAEAADKQEANHGRLRTSVFLAASEIEVLARAVVDGQQPGQGASLPRLVADASSPSLDIAAFGRMFAAQPNLGTHAAIAVSHAVTTHEMTLVSDYFSAVEDNDQSERGVAHIGTAYYTSGVYYRTFCLDIGQLRRSWSSLGAAGAPEDLADLLNCLIKALPTGRVNNSMGQILPALVLAEIQASRCAYEFDCPVPAGVTGGFKEGSIYTLARKRQQALSFDPDNFGEAVVAGQLDGADFQAREVTTLGALVQFIVEAVYSCVQPEELLL